MKHFVYRSFVVGTVSLFIGTASFGISAAPADEVAPAAQPPVTAARPVPSGQLGRVVAIDAIRTRPQGSGVGAVAGGVLGGVIGHEVLGGTAATAIGAVGGAVAGNNLERNHREGVAGYHVHIRLDNGASRTIDQSQIGDLRVGDRVRVQGRRFHRI